MTNIPSRHPVIDPDATSPYAKYGKRPYKYDAVPLHRDGEGQANTPENLARFYERVGVPNPAHRRKR